jgi:negative regulator of genetic competence, sporulation and motility
MEFILINENKIKVMLSASDLEDFEIEAKDLDYANTDTKRMFWDVLSRAKHSTGFDTDGQRVLVQLYPSRHGGCEMFVTEIGLLDKDNDHFEKDSAKEPILSEKITVKAKGEKSKAAKKALLAYGFENLELLIAVCRNLGALGYSGESSAYVGENERFYLFISENEPREYFQLDKYSFINEFGAFENKDSTRLYLSEHGKAICKKDAVARLSKL